VLDPFSAAIQGSLRRLRKLGKTKN